MLVHGVDTGGDNGDDDDAAVVVFQTKETSHRNIPARINNAFEHVVERVPKVCRFKVLNQF